MSPTDFVWLFRVLMEHIPDAVYFKDLENRFVAASRGLAERFRMDDPDRLAGLADFDFFTEEHARQAHEDEREIIRTGIPKINIVEKETWPDREDTWASTTKMPLRDEDGEIIGTFGVSRDITERVKMQEKLRKHAEELDRDIRRARVVHQALLPSKAPEDPHLILSFRHLPFEQIGGDYISFPSLANGGRGIFLADMKGHGVSAALFVALLKFVSDRLSLECGEHPARFIAELNRTLFDFLPSTFLTALYAAFEPEGGAVLVCGAGHPSPILLRRKGGAPEFVKLPSAGALGVLRELKTDTTELALEPGDRLLFYTDGLSETRSGPDRVRRPEELLALVENAVTTSLEETLDRIVDASRELQEEGGLADDVVICGVQRR